MCAPATRLLCSQRLASSSEPRAGVQSCSGSGSRPPRGHGTQVVDGRLLATTCGAVERVDRLISVRPLQTRSAPCSEALSSQLTACLQI
jgi:hypothetical protein